VDQAARGLERVRVRGGGRRPVPAGRDACDHGRRHRASRSRRFAPGDEVLSCYADGSFRRRRSVRTHSSSCAATSWRSRRARPHPRQHAGALPLRADANDEELRRPRPAARCGYAAARCEFREYRPGRAAGMLMLQSDGMTDLVKSVETFPGGA
jgi:hypothetical protein